MGLTQEERMAIVQFKIEKANIAINQLEHLRQMQYWDLVANRMYYAVYNAVSALAVSNQQTAQTHSGLIRIFGMHYVKEGLFTKEESRLYSRLFSLRQTGDYGDQFFLEEEDVAPLIEPTKAFVRKTISLIENDKER